MTTELANRLKRTQRQMLRMILNSPRRRNETSATTTHNNTITPNNNNSNNNNSEHEDGKTMRHPTASPEQAQEPTTATNKATQHNNPNDSDPASDSDSNASDADSSPNEATLIPPNDNTHGNDEMESWPDFIRRCTHEAERQLTQIDIEDWTTKQRRTKWKWAQHVATDTNNKWTITAAAWDPTEIIRYNTRRRQARPKTRWSDDIDEHIRKHHKDTSENHWLTLARNDKVWNMMEEDYAKKIQ